MNNVILSGRLTADPEFRNHEETAISKYTLAVDRTKEGTDFIRCVAFGKKAEFAANYLKKGMKIIVNGRIQTGSYTNKDGNKVYTTDVIVDNHEFCESKKSQEAPVGNAPADFMKIPEGMDSELPFN